MDEEVKNIGMHSKSDHKPVEASASQTDPSSQSSICDELREPSIPPARFWALCVGYVIATDLLTYTLLTFTTKCLSRSLSIYDRYIYRCYQPSQHRCRF